MMLGFKDIIDKAFKFGDLSKDLVFLFINRVSIASDGFEISSKQWIELLKSDANLAHVDQNGVHVLGFYEDLLCLREVPTLDCCLLFDVHFSVMELLLPLCQDIDTLVDNGDGCIWLHSEDTLDVDLASDFVADFVRDALQKVFHLPLILVNVAGDSPD